ncbi:MAG: O-antigen ligase family protein, partial [Caldilineaceae bacterium]|nr:O-antigen ligase family protein [Caldilineaceae bacterium]
AHIGLRVKPREFAESSAPVSPLPPDERQMKSGWQEERSHSSVEPAPAAAVRIRVARPRPIEDMVLQALRRNEDELTQRFIFASRALLGMAAVSALLFWCSAAVGAWVAYDRVEAAGRFTLLTVGLLLIGLIYYATRQSGAQMASGQTGDGQIGRVTQVLRTVTAVGLDGGLLAGGIGLLFLLTHNWQLATEQDFTLLPWVTTWIQEQQPFGSGGFLLHENLVAGALMILLPVAIVALWQGGKSPPALYRYCAGAGTAVGMVALMLTFSRGAWFGLVVGVVATVYLYWRTDSADQQRRERQATVAQHPARRSGYRRRRRSGKRPAGLAQWLQHWGHGERMLPQFALLDGLMGSAVVMGLAFFVGITVSPFLHDLLLRPLAGTYLEMNINSRIAVWQDVLPLIQDYPYTGSGLGSTPMVLASYVYLLHVPYLNHAHNLYLQVAIEQGLPGLIGLLGLIISAGGLGWLWLRYGSRAERGLAAGVLVAFIALLIYGCTDAEFYVGIFVPLLFLPFALLIACAPWIAATEMVTLLTRESVTDQRALWAAGKWSVALGLAVPLFALLFLFLLPGTPARWLVNQATVAQTRQELALYEWPEWPIQDALRRSDQIETTRWVATYEAVLRTDAENVTAERRLGQILLSQGEYPRAAKLLSAAYRQAPQQRATRQLLGEAKALLGDQAQAAALWDTVDLSQGQLDLRLWWYEHIGDKSEIQQFAQVMDQRRQVP